MTSPPLTSLSAAVPAVANSRHGSNKGDWKMWPWQRAFACPCPAYRANHFDSKTPFGTNRAAGHYAECLQPILLRHQHAGLVLECSKQSSETFLPVFVHVCNSVTGTIAVQLLRLSSLDSITTCWPHDFAPFLPRRVRKWAVRHWGLWMGDMSAWGFTARAWPESGDETHSSRQVYHDIINLREESLAASSKPKSFKRFFPIFECLYWSGRAGG